MTSMNMSPKIQLVKCTLCVILYLLTCFFLLRLNQSYNLSDNTFVKKDQSRQSYYLTTIKLNLKSNNRKKQLLEHDELKGELIDQQEIAALLYQVSNICIKYNLKTPLIRTHFLYSSKHKSLYCWIRKVASTSFTKLFFDMQNHRVLQNYYREGNNLAPSSINDLQILINDTNIFKLLLVRHPFERLVSSYRDRIEDNTKYTDQAWIYARRIYQLTRPNLFKSNATSGNSLQRIFKFNKKLNIVPTFKEFIEWLLHEPSEHDDVHWDQYYSHCAVCNISYSFILKLDHYTFGQINYIFSKFGVDKSKTYLPNLERSKGGITDFKQTCKYLQNLTHDDILKLHKRYSIDFEMYNYNLDKYIQCASGIIEI